MGSDISAEEIEILQEFVQESRDMIDHLEPTIIQLGESCRGGDCWAIMNCVNTGCPRHGQHFEVPCWLHVGCVGSGSGTCSAASSPQDCLTCEVFRLTNGDIDTMNAIFRLFHSMKGSAGFLELKKMSQVAHAAENLLDRIRSGKVMMVPAHVDLLCQSCDFAKAALDYVESNFNDHGMSDAAVAITEHLQQAIAEATAVVQAGPVEEPEVVPLREEAPAAAAPEQTASPAMPDFVMEVTPEMVQGFVQEADELLASAEQGLLQWSEAPGDLDTVATLFRALHSFKGNCGFFNFADLERLSHQLETVMDKAKSGADFTGLDAATSILRVVDVLRNGVADISRGGPGRVSDLDGHLTVLRGLLEALDKPASLSGPVSGSVGPAVATSTIPVEASSVRTAAGPAAGEIDLRQTSAPPSAPAGGASRPSGPSAPANGEPAKAATVTRQDIRVDLVKLDNLINLIGELVISENMLIHNPDLENLELENFNKAAQQMGKIIRDLQEMAMIIRMVPVSGLFRRMIRLVHDISGKAGKKVDLQLLGEETEIDKTVIETISDPLVHLLRNSLDHGLEPPEERRRNDKPDKGVIKLSARHEEGEVWITVEDDGRGLDREKLLAKAISRGMIEGDGSEMSDREVFQLIFAPGFSTAEKVTDISGRGVGMDVVKQNLEKIKGKIEVTSKTGKGTRINLRIPLTLAIIDGMLIRVGRARCILPLLAIRDIFRPEAKAITTTPDGQELVNVRGKFYPIIRLHAFLTDDPDDEKDLADGVLVLVEHQGSGLSLFVDEILGQQQTVIKALAGYFGSARYVSGCTILGNGEVCLILDVGGLIELEGKRLG